MMSKKSVINILNNDKVSKAELLNIIKRSNFSVMNPQRYNRLRLIKVIMNKYKINELDIIHFYTVSQLKSTLLKNSNVLKINLRGNSKKKALFDIYMRLRTNLKTNNFKTHCNLQQGRREYMEDNVYYFKNNIIHFSSVFDGHGGEKCSLFLKRNLYRYFQRSIEKNSRIKLGLINAYKLANNNFLSLKTESGSTCNTLIINKKNGKFYVANVGDSRAIACYKNGSVKEITKDHKPTDPFEKAMIERKGGFVQDKRVDGILAMSRAIGDRKIAHHLSATPDIFEGSIKKIKYIVQASDGLYDVMRSVEVCQFINKFLAKGIPKNRIPKLLVSHAIKIGSQDNVSVIITYIS